MQDYLESGEQLLGDIVYRTETKDNGDTVTVAYFDINDNIIRSYTCQKICVSDSTVGGYSTGGGVWIPKSENK